MAYNQWAPYVPVAKRRAQADKKMQALRKKGMVVEPVAIEGRKITRTFWGESWCDHLEGFSDYENRLPRGRAYVRNGSVCHLGIASGKIEAMVSGSSLYNVTIEISTLPAPRWEALKSRCAGQIGSLLDLLRGQLSKDAMTVVTHPHDGLFPRPGELRFRCSCPDWADMCKHVAAVLYGVGARLDAMPELLFRLRGVDHEELIHVEADVLAATTQRRGAQGKRRRLENTELADVFNIELTEGKAPAKPDPATAPPAPPHPAGKAPAPKSAPPPTTAGAAGPSRRKPSPKRAAPETASDASARRVPTRRSVALENEVQGSGKGLTPSELAQLLGVVEAAVAHKEGGRKKRENLGGATQARRSKGKTRSG